MEEKFYNVMLSKRQFLHDAILTAIDMSISGEQFIRNYYKFPLALFVLGNCDAASEIYKQVINQNANEIEREFNTYYDCWLYLYSKLVGNANAKLHYDKIMKNRTVTGGFSALPKQYPELRATAISGICAFFEQDTLQLIKAAEYICQLERLNIDKDNFYFMTDEKNHLIRGFPVEQERYYVFKTKSTKPLLYSFPLAIILLSCARSICSDNEYMKTAKKYAQKIMCKDNLQNDYCGKSAIAVSLLYNFTGEKQYQKVTSWLLNYICQTDVHNNGYVHDNQKLTVDRLAEYAIGLEFCYKAIKKTIPYHIMRYIQKHSLYIQ